MPRLVSLLVGGALTIVSTSGCSTSIDDGGAGGASLEDDGPVTIGATSATQAASNAGAGSGTHDGPCGGITPLAQPDALAATPRTDADAEVLALEASGAFVAPEALYARVHDELAIIRAMAPEIAMISPRSNLVPALVLLELDEGTAGAVARGEATDVACLSTLYGAVSLGPKGDPTLSEWTYADFGAKVIDTVALADQYARLEGVVQAQAAGNETDGPDVCLHAEGDAHIYIFDAAGGDCPAGCTEHLYSGFRVFPGEPPERLGEFDPYLDVDPTWFTSATRCKTLL